MRLDGKAIKLNSIPADRLVTDDLQARFAVTSWGAAVDVDGSNKSTTLEMLTVDGDALSSAEIVRVTCPAGATLTVGTEGSALSGDGTEDVIAQTNATGVLDLDVYCEDAIVLTLVSGPTQGSRLQDNRVTQDLDFS